MTSFFIKCLLHWSYSSQQKQIRKSWCLIHAGCMRSVCVSWIISLLITSWQVTPAHVAYAHHMQLCDLLLFPHHVHDSQQKQTLNYPWIVISQHFTSVSLLSAEYDNITIYQEKSCHNYVCELHQINNAVVISLDFPAVNCILVSLFFLSLQNFWSIAVSTLLWLDMTFSHDVSPFHLM